MRDIVSECLSRSPIYEYPTILNQVFFFFFRSFLDYFISPYNSLQSEVQDNMNYTQNLLVLNLLRTINRLNNFKNVITCTKNIKTNIYFLNKQYPTTHKLINLLIKFGLQHHPIRQSRIKMLTVSCL